MLIVKTTFIVFIFFIIGGVLGIVVSGHALMADLKRLKQELGRYQTFFNIYDKWLELKQGGKKLKDYLQLKGYNNIAIYGIGKIGERFYKDLVLEGGKVLYIIDKNKSRFKCDVQCFSPECELPEADVVIVTAICDYDTIKEDIRVKVKCPIVSLEKVILDCINETV